MATRSKPGSPRRTSIQVRFIVLAAIIAVATFVALRVWIDWNLPLVWIISWTLVTFAFYGFDKFQAVRQRSRVPETSLFVMAAAGGFVGAIGGMLVFRHKTAKTKFWVVNLGSLAAYAILFILSVR